MNLIETQVRRARRRLIISRFGHLAAWSLFVGWFLAAIAISAAAVWVLPWDAELWSWGWIGGTTAIALVGSLVVAIMTAPSVSRVAAEVDSRFGLRERLSSVMTLAAGDRESVMGQALVADAVRRAEPIDVRDRFSIRPDRVGWLPLVPAALVAVAMMIGPATAPDPEAAIDAQLVSQTAQVKTAAAALKRKIQQQRDRAEATGLKDAEDFFKKLETDLNKLTDRPSLDQKDAMIAMNDIKKQLDQRRDQLGTPEQMKSALAKMEDFEKGPAGEVVKSMKKGEFGEAQKQIKELADKLRDGKLSEKEQEELKKQIEKLGEQLAKAAEKHEQAKEQLRQQIDQAKKEGRNEDAAKMQQQLNQMESQDAQMQQMKQMAEAMNQAAQAMKDGQTGEAADAMQDMADQLGEMQAEMEQMEDLQDTIDQLSQSKEQMRCGSCGGGGCGQCRGNGQGQKGQGKGEGDSEGEPGDGMGKGTGKGERPEEETETGTYDTQVRGQPKEGRGVIAGFADGPNRKGVSREEVKAAVIGAINEKSDPLENQTLPRVERDHTREYFDRLRQGKP